MIFRSRHVEEPDPGSPEPELQITSRQKVIHNEVDLFVALKMDKRSLDLFVLESVPGVRIPPASSL